LIRHKNYVFIEDGDLEVPEWVDRIEMQHLLSSSMRVYVRDVIVNYNGFETTIFGQGFKKHILIEPRLSLPTETVGLKVLYEGGHLVGVLYIRFVPEDPVKYFVELKRFFDAYFRNLGAVLSFAGVIE